MASGLCSRASPSACTGLPVSMTSKASERRNFSSPRKASSSSTIRIFGNHSSVFLESRWTALKLTSIGRSRHLAVENFSDLASQSLARERLGLKMTAFRKHSVGSDGLASIAGHVTDLPYVES